MRITFTLIALLSFASALCQTIIPAGNVRGVWEAAGSPYLIEGEITLPASDSLIIEPGVIVNFQGHYKFIVNGWLLAVGTDSDSIYFTTEDASEGWFGIRFVSTPEGNHLSYCDISYGKSANQLGLDQSGGGVTCSYSSPVIDNCTIHNNWAIMHGAGIYCANSSAQISNCLIIDNISHHYQGAKGGGIGAEWSDVTVDDCTIIGNYAGDDGGGIYLFDSEMRITHCTIAQNWCVEWGGGICNGWDSYMIVSNCTISENWGGDGGGIYLYDSEAVIIGSIIKDNFTEGGNEPYSHNNGGGIFLGYNAPSNLTLRDCRIEGNEAMLNGGGLYCEASSSIAIIKTSILNNSSEESGGGIYLSSSSSVTANSCIIWGNSVDQVSGSPQMMYCDVQGGYPGTGNINQDPLFVFPEQSDYRLQWGSPCIDTGDPACPLDPDGTRADIGALYFDQSHPVNIHLTPHNPPLQLPLTGGEFVYTLWLTGLDPAASECTIWINVTLPDLTIIGPIIGPVTTQIDSGYTVSRQKTQTVPAGVPHGLYSYNAYAVVGTDTSFDSFEFFKLGSNGSDYTIGWTSGSGSFDELPTTDQTTLLPAASCLLPCYPNPFNSSTTIRFGLPEAGKVNLSVYDISGRLVTMLASGWYDAGYHEVVFDAAQLSSGIYLYRMDLKHLSEIRKMILLK